MRKRLGISYLTSAGTWIIRGDGFGVGGDSNPLFKSSFGFTTVDSGLGVSDDSDDEAVGSSSVRDSGAVVRDSGAVVGDDFS